MKIENHTNYQKENLTEFVQIHYRFELHKWNVFFYLLSALFLYLAIFFFHDILFRSIAVFVSVLVIIEMKSNLLPKMQLKQLLRNDPQILKIKNTYSFLEDVIEIENEDGKEQIPYKKVNCIIESPNALYLYLNLNTYYIVSKEKFKKNESSVIEYLKKQVSCYYTYQENKYPFLYTFLKNK